MELPRGDYGEGKSSFFGMCVDTMGKGLKAHLPRINLRVYLGRYGTSLGDYGRENSSFFVCAWKYWANGPLPRINSRVYLGRYDSSSGQLKWGNAFFCMCVETPDKWAFAQDTCKSVLGRHNSSPCLSWWGNIFFFLYKWLLPRLNSRLHFGRHWNFLQ